MVDWLVAGLMFALLLWWLAGWLGNRQRPRRKGDAGGALMAFGLAFMTIFDPAKAASVEEIQRRKDLGDADQGESGQGDGGHDDDDGEEVDRPEHERGRSSD